MFKKFIAYYIIGLFTLAYLMKLFILREGYFETTIAYAILSSWWFLPMFGLYFIWSHWIHLKR